MKETNDYKYIIDESGKTKAIDISTGEMTDTVLIRAPVGSRVYTPRMLQVNKDYLKNKQENALRRIINNDLGKFFFVIHNEEFKDLLPQTITRLIYLNTYMNYDNNKLMLTERTPMKRKDLSQVLNVSKAVVSKFWKEVSPKYIKEHNDGLIFTNTDVFIRRRLKKGGKYNPYHKFYINGIRTLYRSTDINNHRHLGYIFKMLPYINLEYNVLCHNPLEQNLDLINFMSLSEFCEIIQYDISHLNRLCSLYKKIKFDVNGNQEKFCAFTYDGLNRNYAKIFVNPHVLYNGMDYKRVELLGSFCKD